MGRQRHPGAGAAIGHRRRALAVADRTADRRPVRSRGRTASRTDRHVAAEPRTAVGDVGAHAQRGRRGAAGWIRARCGGPARRGRRRPRGHRRLDHDRGPARHDRAELDDERSLHPHHGTVGATPAPRSAAGGRRDQRANRGPDAGVRRHAPHALAPVGNGSFGARGHRRFRGVPGAESGRRAGRRSAVDRSVGS